MVRRALLHNISNYSLLEIKRHPNVNNELKRRGREIIGIENQRNTRCSFLSWQVALYTNGGVAHIVFRESLFTWLSLYV